jgi:spore coat protein U-like protein
MNSNAPPIYGNSTISVTCARHPQDRLSVDVQFELKGLPPEAFRQMRDRVGGAYLAYDMYVDAARTRYWGDGTQGTEVFSGACLLDERNRVCTIPFVLYGKVHGQQQVIPPGPFLGAVVSRLEYRFLSCVP